MLQSLFTFFLIVYHTHTLITSVFLGEPTCHLCQCLGRSNAYTHRYVRIQLDTMDHGTHQPLHVMEFAITVKSTETFIYTIHFCSRNHFADNGEHPFAHGRIKLKIGRKNSYLMLLHYILDLEYRVSTTQAQSFGFRGKGYDASVIVG